MSSVHRTSRTFAALLERGVTAGGTSYVVRRAWPADVRDPGAGVVAELCADPAQDVSGNEAQFIGAVIQGDRVEVFERDPALGLTPPAGLVGWRPGKRAVWRDAHGRYVKVARGRATRRALGRVAAVDRVLTHVADAPTRPIMHHVDVTKGVVVLEPVAGRSLSALLAGDDVGAARDAGERLGSGLAALARVRPTSDDGLPHHGAADEAATLDRWATAALALAPLHDEEADRLRGQVPRVTQQLVETAPPPSEHVLSHRDLHDGQVLVDHAAVTVLDWDLAAWADPVLDVANLIAHVDRYTDTTDPGPGGGSGSGSAAFLTALTGALQAAEHPATTPAGDERFRLTVEASSLRLLAVHAFRPKPRGKASGPNE